MKIGSKLILLNSIIVVGFGLTGLYNLTATKKIIGQFKDIDESFHATVKAAINLSSYAEKVERNMRLYLTVEGSQLQAPISQGESLTSDEQTDTENSLVKTKFLEQQLAVLEANVQAPESRTILAEAKRNYSQLLATRKALILAYENTTESNLELDSDSYSQLAERFNRFADNLSQQGINLAEIETNFLDEQQSRSSLLQQLAVAQRKSLIAVIGGIALAIGLIYWQAKNISRPLTQLQDAAQRVAQGELNTQIEIKSEDEIGQLSFAFNQMTQKIRMLIRETEAATEQTLTTQSQIIQQQKADNESLQQELFKFISSIEEASNGNLTVRANITDGAIGIVADFFNSILESLRDIVAQVKVASTQVNSSISNNESAIEEVAREALRQTEQISQALNQVAEMTRSIQQVADNAQKAASVSHTASATAETGGQAIEETVNSILQLRETIASTAKKVKRLGESSQEISKVVSIINQIAMQTNLLAINASIEASRAGEEGRGFAVVAEEVGELATKSAEATQEIEEIVENIQEETQEVVAAMEIGTSQVVEGTRLVQNTKSNLEKIAEVSYQIDTLLQSISTATISQAETSQTVTELMEGVANVSQRTSDASLNVSESLEKTVKIARQLESSVDTFTV